MSLAVFNDQPAKPVSTVPPLNLRKAVALWSLFKAGLRLLAKLPMALGDACYCLALLGPFEVRNTAHSDNPDYW